MLTNLIFVSFAIGGFPGGGLPGSMVSGVDQPYPHCNGTGVMSAETAIEEVDGTVIDVRVVRPCIGQPPYLLVHMKPLGDAEDGKTQELYLGPAQLLAEQGVQIEIGQLLSSEAVRARNAYTALTIDIDGEFVVLRDDQGRLFSAPSRISH